MTAVSTLKSDTPTEPLLILPKVPWPDGTMWFTLRTWIALGVALYAAFWFELEGASSAGVCVLILAQPAQGMVLSKAIYRSLGTIVGVIVAVLLTALFPQDRTMLLASFTIFIALETALGSILRDFRSYGCILAGYTVAIISISNIDSPNAVFSGAVNRVAAIAVGIAAIAIVNAFMAKAESSRSLITKLRMVTKDIVGLAEAVLDQRRPPEPADLVAMSARLMPLRSEISFATPEKPNGRARAKGARSALLGLFELLSACHAVGAGLANLDSPTPVVEKAIAVMRKALRLQNPEQCSAELEQLGLPFIQSGNWSMEEAFVFERMHFMLDTLANVRDGLRSLRMGWLPRRDVTLPVHQDWFAVVLNGVRVVVAMGIMSGLAVWSGLPDSATAILFTAVFVSLGAVQPDPTVMGKAALLGMPAVGVAGTLYSFFIFPFISGYPLFFVSLFPLVLIMCWLIKIGMPGAGLIFTVQTLVLIAPANVQTLDPTNFVDTATMLAVSGIAIFLAFLLVLPVDPKQRRLRLALATGDSLRNAIADEKKLEQPRASLLYDRLAQFMTWQYGEVPTLARRKTMKRLVDLGSLSLAVRRAWRALDRTKACIDDAALDTRARKVLPSLSAPETLAVARDYLGRAAGKSDRSALDIVHAAAALYGTSLATREEDRLLRHAHLVKKI